MRGLVGVLVVAATVVGFVPAAGARTYDVVACNAPGAHGVNNSWTWGVWTLNGAPSPEDSAAYALSGSCASPSGLRGSSNPNGGTVRWGTYANFTFTAPADTDITRVTLWRYGMGVLGADNPNTALNESGRWEVNAKYGTDDVFADTCHPGSGVWPNPCTVGSPGFSDASKVVHDGRADMFTFGIFCGGDNGPYIACQNGSGSPNGLSDLQGADVRLEDTTAPKTTTSGPLLAAGWRRPSDTVGISATDNSGIQVVRVEIDGRAVSQRPIACDFTRPVPCQTVLNTVRFSAQGIADGTHTLRVIALDAAGNPGGIQRPLQMDGTPPTANLTRARGKRIVLKVSDAASGVASTAVEVRNHGNEPYRPLASTYTNGKLRATMDKGSASKADIRVTARDNAGNVTQGNPTRLTVTSAKVGRRFRKVRSGRVRIPFGRRATLRGRLTLSAGQSLAGQTIAATSVVRKRGARTRAEGTAITDRHGRFAINVPAGASRTYRLVFGGAGGALATARGVSVRVPASSTIHSSRTRLGGAGRVRFSGRVRTRGERIPGRGLLLVLQGFERGKWRTFDDARTNRKGRWHASYSFSGRPGRYPIRVRIRRQNGYPFELGYSRALTIHVG
jgi:hypothetical protein